MSGRALDTATAAALAHGNVKPAILAQLRFRSGTERVWSGVGDLSWNGLTWKGLGNLARMGAITEASAVQAEGTSVTLSGIGLTSIALPSLGVTPPDPPFAPAAGESVAWAFASRTAVINGSFSVPPNVFNAGLGCSGTALIAGSSGSLSMTNGESLGPNRVAIEWVNFAPPPEIPAGARITGAYLAVVCSGSAGAVDFSNTRTHAGGTIFIGPGSGTFYSGNLLGQSIEVDASIANTLPGAASLGMTVAFVGMAFYYEGSPVSTATVMYEALNDIQVGGPAKIWFGLMSGPGTFIGSPYLVFSGVMDKPVVTTSPNGSTITLPLENRLVNLQRPSQKRYTSADQHLEFPDDSAFDFVEPLNDMALRWGS